MDEPELSRLLRELQDRPPDALGDGFSNEVMARLGVERPAGAHRFSSALLALTVVGAAAIGCSVGMTHRLAGSPPSPPPLVGVGAPELFTAP